MVDYLESVADIEPAAGAFSQTNAEKRSIYLLQNPTGASDIQNAIEDILGTTSVSAGDGRLQRIPPYRHPIYPWLYASSVNITGHGWAPPGPTAPADEELTDAGTESITDQFALYNTYFLDVKFTPRPYSVAADETIQLQTGSWYPETDDGVSPAQTFTFAPEWQRYTDYDIQARTDNATAKQGTMNFKTKSGSAPNGFIYPGMPRVYLPNQTVTVKWYFVPFRYANSPNTYFPRWLGRINQNPWWLWLPGELLYIGYKVEKFQPPVAVRSFDGSFASADKLCNISFTFLSTKRCGADVPSTPPSNNRNFVMAGWNLQPWWVDRKFYSTQSNPKPPITATPAAEYLSFPLEILFTDPDIAGGVPTTACDQGYSLSS